MKIFKALFAVFCISIIALSCGASDDVDQPATTPTNNLPTTPTPTNPNPTGGTDTNEYFHTSGTQILDPNGNPIYLQGVAFGNQVWNGGQAPTTHHNETDYQRLASMNMNAVRFYLNYRTFEDDTDPYNYKQSGWDWIDQNITWAKNHGVYLILNMHYPQGGYQSQGDGDDFWLNSTNQDRLSALWITSTVANYCANDY